MTCPYRDLLYREGPKAVPPDHLARCPECAAIASRLQTAQSVLRGQAAPVDPSLPVRVRAAFRQQRNADAWQFNVRAISVGLLGLAAALLYVSGPGFDRARSLEPAEHGPSNVWAIQPAQPRSFGPLAVTAVERTIRLHAPSARTLSLDSGHVRVALSPEPGRPAWRVVTPAAHIELREPARVSVNSGPTETDIRVEAGRVRVEPVRDPKAARWLSVGAQWTVPADRRLRRATATSTASPARPVRAASRPDRTTEPQRRPPSRPRRDPVADADRLRRNKRYAEALVLYRRVLADRRAHRYDREYAGLQGALLLERQQRRTAALEMLRTSPGGWNTGALLPERIRAATALDIALGRIDRAYRRLRAVPVAKMPPAVVEARLLVARAVIAGRAVPSRSAQANPGPSSIHRLEARRLLEAIELSRVDPMLADSVRQALRDIGKKE